MNKKNDNEAKVDKLIQHNNSNELIRGDKFILKKSKYFINLIHLLSFR